MSGWPHDTTAISRLHFAVQARDILFAPYRIVNGLGNYTKLRKIHSVEKVKFLGRENYPRVETGGIQGFFRLRPESCIRYEPA
jgi:hypothetical protein